MAVTYTPAIAEVIEKLEAGNPLPTLVPQESVEHRTDGCSGIDIS